MDPVQELIASVGHAAVEGGHHHAQSSSLSTSSAVVDASGLSASTHPLVASAPRRTKMVFVYSDEDEGGSDDGCKVYVDKRLESGVAEVSCDDLAIDVSADELAELRAEAAPIAAGGMSHAQTPPLSNSGDASGFSFEEDVVSGLVSRVSAPSASVEGMRVREVTAPRLWEGAVGPTVSTGLGDGDVHFVSTADEMPLFLRRGLPAANFVLQSRRKRFRELSALDGTTTQLSLRNTAAAAAAAAAESEAASCATVVESSPHVPSPSLELHEVPSQGGLHGDGSLSEDDGDTTIIEEEEEETDVYPVYADDGSTVRALRTRGGYELTLDEGDLLEGFTEEERDEGDAMEEGVESCGCGALPAATAVAAAEEANGDDHDAGHSDVQPTAMSLQPASSVVADIADEERGGGADEDLPVLAGEEDGGDFDNFDEGDDDDDEEEEEELDEAIIVAVVEQLVRCCEADDLDPQMSVEAGRFVATAKPLLEQLTKEVISPTEFVQRMDRDLRRFQRIYKSVYRPRDLPIVVDGVVMDL
ncbi:hypothetical protein JKF63_03676 [Porcisia hertigi]|uniref:Uncharacterized protein n=1 Tax=Porcisia hertigi TaxID=2761500 RepID=A0A836HX02_9TRYP|nr:hypothetical protein JKF63_03676 [Porcisia hertigi]